MEKLSSRLEDYSVVLDVLDGVKAHPNADKDYAVVLKIVRQIHEEIATLKGRLEESKRIIVRQQALSQAVDSMTERLKYLTENVQFYPESIREETSRISTPEPNVCRAHSSPITSPFFPELTNNSNRCTSSLQPPEVRNPVQPKTPKPVNDLTVAISYLSGEDFNKIPAYMKGRLRADEINSFVTQFNTVLNKKLALLKKPKKSLKLKKEMDLVTEWKEQAAPALSGQYFLSAKDFVSLTEYKFSKKDFSIITILRHVQRIKEARVGKTVFYVACF